MTILAMPKYTTVVMIQEVIKLLGGLGRNDQITELKVTKRGR